MTNKCEQNSDCWVKHIAMGGSFDFIFLDPPYHQGLGQKAVKLISESNLVHAGSILVLETHKTEDPPETVRRLRSVKTKKHGDTKITFYLTS